MAHKIIATGHRGQVVELELGTDDLKGMIRDSIYNGVRASMEIEGEDPGPYCPPPINSVPDELLRTD